MGTSRTPKSPLGERAGRILAIAEKCALLVLLLAALLLRLRSLNGPFDREFDGFQGASLAVSAVNYERLGFFAYGGYPVFNIDLPKDAETLPYVYPNHPPVLPALAWVGLKLFGPAGWDRAWQHAEPPPPGSERAERLPALCAHMLALLALWWCVRSFGRPRSALLALAFAAFLPIQVLYGSLVNFENFVWPLALVGVGFHGRYLMRGKRHDLLLASLSMLVASCVTFSPAFLVPPLVLMALSWRGFKRAVKTGAALSVATLTPALLHTLWVRHVLPAQYSTSVVSRASRLIGPMFDGQHPIGEWLRRLGLRCEFFFTLPVLVLAGAGLVALFVRAIRSRGSRAGERTDSSHSPGPVLLAGGLLLMLSFYQHTWDGAGARNGQTVFLLNLAPGIAVLAAEALAALAAPLQRLRAGDAPLMLLAFTVLLPSVFRAERVRQQWRDPGPFDEPATKDGPLAPLPSTVGSQVARLLPAGAVGIYPQELGLSVAASYYAWRTLIPATPKTYDLALLRIQDAYGLKDAPRYILIPKNPPPSAVKACAKTRSIVAEEFDRIAESPDWELWPALGGSPAPESQAAPVDGEDAPRDPAGH